VTDSARGVIDPGSTSVVIPGVPAGATLTVTAHAEDVYGQVSDPVTDTIDTTTEQVVLTDPITSVPILTTQTNPALGLVGAQPFLASEWLAGVQNGDFRSPPPDTGLPVDLSDKRPAREGQPHAA